MKRSFQTWAGNLVVVTLAVWVICPTSGQEKKASGQDKASIWMKQKREYTQNILAGLTEGDFDKINTNAAAMNFLGYLEKWARAGQPEYKQQATYFTFANRELLRHAKEKNIDGATLAFTQLTTSCVQCHKIVRDAK